MAPGTPRMRCPSPLWPAVLLALAAPGMVRGQGPAAQIRWQPAAAIEGSVVSLYVAPAPGATFIPVRGRLSGESLHFDSTPGGTFHALGAVPIGAPDSVPVEVHLEDGTGVTEGAIVWIRVARRRVPVERIRTDPRFARAPDSALAARIAAERDRIRTVLRRTHDTRRLWNEPFVRPRASKVTSVFGTRRIVNGVAGGRHWGTDLDGRTGEPVRAANRGVIALVGEFYYGGCLVYLDHGAGLVTGYLHLSEILVAEGDTVAAGQLIGRVGATGRVTGPHLHWLANYGRVSVDPLGLERVDPGGAVATVGAGPGAAVSAPQERAPPADTSGSRCRP